MMNTNNTTSIPSFFDSSRYQSIWVKEEDNYDRIIDSYSRGEDFFTVNGFATTFTMLINDIYRTTHYNQDAEFDDIVAIPSKTRFKVKVRVKSISKFLPGNL